jgi:hypothetical protein
MASISSTNPSYTFLKANKSNSFYNKQVSLQLCKLRNAEAKRFSTRTKICFNHPTNLIKLIKEHNFKKVKNAIQPFLVINFAHYGICDVCLQYGGQNLLAKVEIDEASAGEFGHPPPRGVQALHAVAETFLKMGNTTCHQDVPQLRPQYKCSAL